MPTETRVGNVMVLQGSAVITTSRYTSIKVRTIFKGGIADEVVRANDIATDGLPSRKIGSNIGGG